MRIRYRGFIVEQKGDAVHLINSGTGMTVAVVEEADKKPIDHELSEIELQAVVNCHWKKSYAAAGRNKDRFRREDGQR